MKGNYASNISLLMILFGLFSSLHAQLDNSQTTLNAHYQKKLEQYFSVNAASNNFSGNILVAKDEKILFSKSYGKANYEWNIPQSINTKIKIASVTKTFTSGAILILIKQGKLSLKQSIDKFIPDFPSGNKITIENLLKHMAGVPNPDYSKLNSKHHLSNDEILETIKSKPLLFEPGTNDSYSNGGYFVLAYIIEKVSGKTYGDFLKENIFDPLKMHDTGIYEDEPLITNRAESYSIGPNNSLIHTDWYSSEPSLGSGSLFSTASDLFKWCKAVKNKTLFDIYSVEYPFGWGRRRPKNATHFITQSGYNNGHQALLMIYEDGYIVVFNSNIGNTFFNKVADDVRAILFGGEYRIPEPKRYIVLPESTLRKYVGEYQLKDQPNFKISFDKRSLYFQFTGASFRNYLVPLTENSFEMREEFSTITFNNNAKGEVDSLTISFGPTDAGTVALKIN